MSLALQPSGSWVRVDVLAGSPDIVRLSSTRPWPDPPAYYGGQKVGEVVAWGDVVRALSDRSGSPVVGRFAFDVLDFQGYWRDLLTSATYLTSQDVTFYLASEQAHDLAVLADPRLAFRGQIVRASPRPNRRFGIDAESRIGTRYGPFNLDSPCLTRSFGDGIGGSPATNDFPNLPREFQARAVPFLWGELSDEGALSAPPDPDAEPYDAAAGMVIPTYCGYLAGDEPTYALAPTNLQCVITGTGPSATVRIAVSTVTANGETLPTILEVEDYPQPATASHYADWTWDDPNGSPTPAIAHPVYIDNLDGTGWHRLDLMNNGATFVDPEHAYTDDGDDNHWKNLYPRPVEANTAVIGDTAEFFCLLGHPGRITKIYASNLAAEPAYQAVEASEIGEGNYFDLGTDGDGYLTTINGRTYFGFLARGPKAEAHKNGTMPFRVNLCGWHDGETPSLLIDEAASVYQDVFVQLQGGPHGAGYQSGARLTIPSFRSAPTVPILQSTTFAAVQALTAAEMGSPSRGCLATVYLDSFETTWRSFMEGMNRTFFWDTGENHHGQTLLAMMPGTVDPTDGPIFREFIDIQRVEDAGETQPDQIENVVRYQYDRHPISGAYRSGVQTLRDQASIEGYGGERAADRVLELPYTRDSASADYCMGRYLADRATAPAYPAVVTKLRKGVVVELGTQFRIEHSDLGATAVPVYCRSHTLSTSRGTVRLQGRRRT